MLLEFLVWLPSILIFAVGLTHTIEWAVTPSGARQASNKAYTGSLETNFDEAIADSATDTLIAFTLDVSAVKSYYIVSDQIVTLEFNNATTGVPTMVLAANVPYIWTTDSYDTFLLTADITPGVYVTNASGATANIKQRALVDATP